MKQCLLYLTFEYCSVFITTPLKTGLGLTYSSSKKIHSDTCCVIAFAFLVWFPNVKCAFSRRRPKISVIVQGKLSKYVADFEWVFISKSKFGLYLIRLLLRSLFFLLLTKIKKKRKILYLIIITTKTKNRRQIMQIGEVEVLFWTLIGSNQQNNVAISTTDLVFAQFCYTFMQL